MNDSIKSKLKKTTITNGKKRSSRIWLIGTFFQTEYSGRLSAFYEVLFGLMIGTLPFWIGGLVLVARGKGFLDADEFWLHYYWKLTRTTFEKGELLIFSISFLSPAFWLLAHEPDGAGSLPHKRPIAVITLIICIIGIALFSVMQAEIPVNMPAIYNISLWLTGFSVATMYLALTYHGFRLPPVDLTERVFRENQESFLNDYQKRREGIE